MATLIERKNLRHTYTLVGWAKWMLTHRTQTLLEMMETDEISPLLPDLVEVAPFTEVDTAHVLAVSPFNIDELSTRWTWPQSQTYRQWGYGNLLDRSPMLMHLPSDNYTKKQYKRLNSFYWQFGCDCKGWTFVCSNTLCMLLRNIHVYQRFHLCCLVGFSSMLNERRARVHVKIHTTSNASKMAGLMVLGRDQRECVWEQFVRWFTTLFRIIDNLSIILNRQIIYYCLYSKYCLTVPRSPPTTFWQIARPYFRVPRLDKKFARVTYSPWPEYTGTCKMKYAWRSAEGMDLSQIVSALMPMPSLIVMFSQLGAKRPVQRECVWLLPTTCMF